MMSRGNKDLPERFDRVFQQELIEYLIIKSNNIDVDKVMKLGLSKIGTLTEDIRERFNQIPPIELSGSCTILSKLILIAFIPVKLSLPHLIVTKLFKTNHDEERHDKVTS